MTDQDMEIRIAEALDHAAPDDLDDVLSRIDAGKGLSTVTNDTMKKKSGGRRWRPLIAAVLALVLLGGAGGGWWYTQNAVATVVSLDVNPSIEISINRNEKVLTCTPMNEDATVILEDMGGGADLVGTTLDVAVNAVVGSLLRNGYLDSLSSAILVSVNDGDADRAARIQQEVVAAVDSILQGASNPSSVYSQYLTPDDSKNVDTIVSQDNISLGKAALVQRVMETNGITDQAALAALSVEELMDLLETRESRLPVGMEAAASAALAFAGIQTSDASHIDVDPELDDPAPHYEVEIHVPSAASQTSHGEFEYTVDAFSGDVLSGQRDILNAVSSQSGTGTAQQPGTTQPGETTQPGGTQGSGTQGSAGTPGATQQPGAAGSDIGSDAALQAALAHAGVSAAEASVTKSRLDWDDGRQIYEIEFTAGGFEYDYEILASDGTVVKSSREQLPAAPAGSITEDAAWNAVSSDLASRWPELSGQELSRTKCEYDHDDHCYEVEFWCGGYEFDCKVNSSTGAVTGWDTDYSTSVTHHPETDHHSDSHHSGTSAGTGTGDIGAEAAKSAALSHAGLTSSQVTGLRAEADWDDGRLEYEVQFRSGQYEYEYTIDGSTGAVLEHEMDVDD